MHKQHLVYFMYAAGSNLCMFVFFYHLLITKQFWKWHWNSTSGLWQMHIECYGLLLLHSHSSQSGLSHKHLSLPAFITLHLRLLKRGNNKYGSYHLPATKTKCPYCGDFVKYLTKTNLKHCMQEGDNVSIILEEWKKTFKQHGWELFYQSILIPIQSIWKI